MASLEIAFQIKVIGTSIRITSIKYKASFYSPYYFRIEDQPVELHPEFSETIKLRKQIKNGDYIPLTLKGAVLERYYDLNSKRFWFNGRHLESSTGNDSTVRYNSCKCIDLLIFNLFKYICI